MSMISIYFNIKDNVREKYGDKTLLLFQVGAFYEVYTKVDPVSKEITEHQVIDFKRFTELASAKKTEDTLMMGFRDYMIEKYIDKIQQNGYTAVVYNQDAATTNTTRSLLGVFSPGTFFSVNNEEISNNMACIWIHCNTKTLLHGKGNIIIGMSTIDNFTGKSSFYEITTENIHNPTTYDELERFISTYNPSETILISNLHENRVRDIINYVKIESKQIHVISSDDTRVKNAEKQCYQRELLMKFFSDNISESLYNGAFEFVYGIQSYVYLLNFVYEHNPNLVNKIHEPVIENNTDRMLLANHSLQQLNIIDDHKYKGKLSSVSSFLNNCITSIGMRNFKNTILNPTTNKDTLVVKYDITEYLLKQNNWNGWRTELKNIRDIEKLNRQIYLKKIPPQSLFGFYDNLSTIHLLFVSVMNDEMIINYLSREVNMNIVEICQQFSRMFNDTFIIDKCKDVTSLDTDINFIKKGVNTDLDKYIDLHENSRNKLESIRDYLDTLIAKGDKSTKHDFIKIHETDKNGITLQSTSRRGTILKQQLQAGKYNVQLSYKNVNGVTETYEFAHDVHTSTSTGSNVNISNEVITKLCNDITQSRQNIKEMVIFVYNTFIHELEKYENEFNNLVQFTSSIDLLQNMCYIANKYKYCKPTIKSGDKSYIIAKEIRHPLIEQLNTSELYISNDISIGNDNDIMLLYGTNAVGKTSIIRAVGISLIMAQSGLFVPCSNFEFVPYTGIFTRILGNDNLFKGLSTFAVEMSELRIILKMANEQSLILGDELCSGTEHDSAVSIFVSGIESLYKKRTSAIFATHLHEIVKYDEIKQMDKISIKHMTVSYNIEKDLLIYDRKMKDGPGESMYGLEVCKSLHLPDDFLEHAYEIRRKYKKEEEGVLAKKSSHFNKKKVVGVCEMCNNNMGIEIHHLQHQSVADKNNMISHFHKNHPANLLSVCESCHNKFHKSDKQHKKVKTTKGIQLMEI